MANVFVLLKGLTDSFFDNLKANATRQALEKGNKNVCKKPLPVIEKMKELEEENEWLDSIIDEYSEGSEDS